MADSEVWAFSNQMLKSNTENWSYLHWVEENTTPNKWSCSFVCVRCLKKIEKKIPWQFYKCLCFFCLNTQFKKKNINTAFCQLYFYYIWIYILYCYIYIYIILSFLQQKQLSYNSSGRLVWDTQNLNYVFSSLHEELIICLH